MTSSDLEAAAFWQSRVCLDCEAVVDDEAHDSCPTCGSDDLVAADLAVRCWKLVENAE